MVTPRRSLFPGCGRAAALLVLLGAGPARAGFTDVDPDTPGIQSGSWTEPAKITVYIPAGLAGADRMMFQMGVSSWDPCLTMVMICFADGDPPAGAVNPVTVRLVPAGSLMGGRLGEAEISVTIPDGMNHGPIDSATISIDMGALGHGNLMKNLGAHEFGHALGLDDVPHPATGRVDVMDPEFDQTSPFLMPTAADKMMLAEFYAVAPAAIPVPSTLSLLGAGLLAAAGTGLGRRARWGAVGPG
jgi:hypothetical protein